MKTAVNVCLWQVLLRYNCAALVLSDSATTDKTSACLRNSTHAAQASGDPASIMLLHFIYYLYRPIKVASTLLALGSSVSLLIKIRCFSAFPFGK